MTMFETSLLHQLIEASAERFTHRPALAFGAESVDYRALHESVRAFAAGLRALGIDKSERVAIYLDKRAETVIAAFGATAAGAVFVPLNPLLKPAQVGYIPRDCNARPVT
jgi:acyl-CoA synthetase (AMP-forming)/AMP-acid ligase II